MTQHIHEGAARYQPGHHGNNSPAPSATQALANPQQLLTEHIDLWTTAVRHKSTAGRGSNRKLELAGINKLRELILELAVRGKLVPQNPDDEPATELLKRIEVEKAQLIKDGKLKKQKPLPPVTDEEKPFELPQGWEWVRLADLSLLVTDGVHHTPTYLESGVPFISVKDIDGKEISFDNCKYISEEQHLEINKRCNPEYGDLLICRIGTLGRVTPVSTTIPFSLFVSVGLIKTPKTVTITQYFHSLLNSPILYRQYDEIKAGGSHTNKLNLGDIPKLKLPVPPLAEQQHIVAKVDELMTLCDQLEQQSEHQLDAHQQLTETLLSALLTPASGALTDAADAQELSDNWQRLAQHFDLLFSGPMGAWAIDRLKDTILQLAVMGKLVPQNPDDEPAAELLKRIDAEKARLVKEGKIKKQKPLPPVSDDEKPFELPQGWVWVRFGDATVNRDAERIPLSVDERQHRRGEFDYYGASGVIDNIDDFLFDKPLLLIGEDGANLINRSTPIAFMARGKYWVNNHAHVIDAISEQFLIYICMYINSISLVPYVTGTAQPKMNQAKMNTIVLAIPPQAEQHRIVAKVDELFALCDQLKERLQHASDTQLNLTDAIVEQALY